MCRRYSQRPSQVLAIRDRMLALDFDLAMSSVHRIEADSRVKAQIDAGGAFGSALQALLELL